MVTENLINIQYASVKEKFPKLRRPIRINEGWEIEGAIDVVDDEGYLWGSYEVKIIVPKKYPGEIFILQETGGQIPKKSSWHNINSCCVSTNAIIYSTLGEDLSLLNWIVKFAHPFLANHLYKYKTGQYANGEFQHATVGIIQGYEKLFGLSGVKEIYQKLNTLCNVLKIGRNDFCFCGSGIKFKYCYLRFPFTHKFASIPYPLLQEDLEEIRNYKRS